VKLCLDGPDWDTSPFTADEMRRTVAAVHARGATATAHSSLPPGSRAAVAGGSTRSSTASGWTRTSPGP
jgi:hypothetical protein